LDRKSVTKKLIFQGAIHKLPSTHSSAHVAHKKKKKKKKKKAKKSNTDETGEKDSNASLTPTKVSSLLRLVSLNLSTPKSVEKPKELKTLESPGSNCSSSKHGSQSTVASQSKPSIPNIVEQIPNTWLPSVSSKEWGSNQSESSISLSKDTTSDKTFVPNRSSLVPKPSSSAIPSKQTLKPGVKHDINGTLFSNAHTLSSQLFKWKKQSEKATFAAGSSSASASQRGPSVEIGQEQGMNSSSKNGVETVKTIKPSQSVLVPKPCTPQLMSASPSKSHVQKGQDKKSYHNKFAQPQLFSRPHVLSSSLIKQVATSAAKANPLISTSKSKHASDVSSKIFSPSASKSELAKKRKVDESNPDSSSNNLGGDERKSGPKDMKRKESSALRMTSSSSSSSKHHNFSLKDLSLPGSSQVHPFQTHSDHRL